MSIVMPKQAFSAEMKVEHGNEPWETPCPFSPQTAAPTVRGRVGSDQSAACFPLTAPCLGNGNGVSWIFTALRQGSHGCPLTHFHSVSVPKCRSKASLPGPGPGPGPGPVPVAGSLPPVPGFHGPPAQCCPAPFCHQLIWCVGSPSVWPEVVEGFLQTQHCACTEVAVSFCSSAPSCVQRDEPEPQ